MAFNGYTALLLLLGAITPGFAADALDCNFPNKTAQSSDYRLRVLPERLFNDTVYTVTVAGNGNVKVILQAVFNNTAVGTWSQTGGITCNGGPLFNVTLTENSSLAANWTSPSVQIPEFVKISVSITNGNETYNLAKTLYAANGSSVQAMSQLLVIAEALGLLLIISKLV